MSHLPKVIQLESGKAGLDLGLSGGKLSVLSLLGDSSFLRAKGIRGRFTASKVPEVCTRETKAHGWCLCFPSVMK